MNADNGEQAAITGETNRVAEAEAELRQALHIDPANAEYGNDLGWILFAQERYEEAADIQVEAVRLEPKNALYQSNLGRALFALKRWAEAEAAYRAAMRLDPGNASHPDGLGICLFAQKRYRDAEVFYRKAMQLDDRVPDYLDHLAAALSEQGEHSEAVTQSKKAMQASPDKPFYHHRLATCLYRAGLYEEAEREESLAIELSKSPVLAAQFRVTLATIMLTQDRLSESRQELLTAEKELAGGELGVISSIEALMGNILERQGTAREAEARYRKAIALDKTNSCAHNLVILLSANRQFAEAAEVAYRGIERVPTSWRILYALGILAMDEAAEYHDNSYYDDAIKCFQDALDALLKDTPTRLPMEDRAKIHFHLGYAYAKLGRARSAAEEFRKSKKYARRYSRTWFATEANLRRYQRKLSPTASVRSQAAVFSTLGSALIAAIVILELSQELSSPYLVALIAFTIILFAMAFYLPIITNIRLGPVALEKQAVRISTELPEPIGSTRMSLDIALSQWRIDQPSPMSAQQTPPLPAQPTVATTKPAPQVAKPGRSSPAELLQGDQPNDVPSVYLP